MKKPKSLLDTPVFRLESSTILLLEGPEVANAENIRSMLNDNLQSRFGVDFKSISESFTIVTDGAPVMARMAGSSTSRRVASQSEKWMRCYLHTLDNCMKHAMNNCQSDSTLKKLLDDFKSMKRIVEDSKRVGWN